jgi:hypothetical protein
MATPRKNLLIRIDPKLHAALQRWADDELRSLNGQIEFLLANAVRTHGIKLPAKDESDSKET